MVRNELINKLKEEILHYIGVPYWMNTLKAGVVIKSGFKGGKGTSQEIAIETITKLQKEKYDVLSLNSQDIYNFQKKNKIGIDCSGLTSNLLNFILKNKSIDFQIDQFKTNANMLTSSPLSKKIDNYDDIQTGDMFRVDNGKHVIFIIEKLDNIISYVQSSNKTFTRGVHYGNMEIIDKNKGLEFQKWTDKLDNGDDYNKIIDSSKGDGIFRLIALEK